MNYRTAIICYIFIFSTSAFGEITCKLISFDDLKPAGTSLDECWGGIGMDRRGNVYIGISDRYGEGPDDALIFRYNTRTGERKYLTSLRAISASKGNLGPN